MRLPWQRHDPPDPDQPDPAAATQRLEQVRAQRPHVHRLIVALRVERELNNFGRNAEAVFMGRGQE